MNLAGLLLTADGDPAERARLADVQIETIDLLLGTQAGDSLSPTLRLAAVRQALSELHLWCPLLREAEKVAAENALSLAFASLDLSQIVTGADGGPDLNRHHRRSWDEFLSAPNLSPEMRARIRTALSIKRQLLGLTAKLERQAAEDDLARHNSDFKGANGGRPTDAMLNAASTDFNGGAASLPDGCPRTQERGLPIEVDSR